MFEWFKYWFDRFKKNDDRSFKSFMYFCQHSGDEELAELALEYEDLPELIITMYPSFTYEQIYNMKWWEIKRRYKKILNELSGQSELIRQMEKLSPQLYAPASGVQRFSNYIIKEDNK